jgi:UDP-N-acetylglucosamine 4,6-dehydratase (inverting)
VLNEQAILITGGTGSFGRKVVRTILERFKPRRLLVFSRDELKQFEMAQEFPIERYPCLRYFLGDVRDIDRLKEALPGVDVIIHAAAIKQVPAAEYNPFEAVRTNVVGAQNVIRAAISRRVRRVIALSTDKAANPINLYGATKLCSDKLFIAGNAMSGHAGTVFSVVRYGNVIGSRGSIIPYFLKMRRSGVLPITDKRMTRFSITLAQAANFVLRCLGQMHGGELFVPRIPSYRLMDVAQAIAPEAQIKFIGIRPGEKLHEQLITVDDARKTMEFRDHFVIQPDFGWWTKQEHLEESGGQRCPEGFSYSSGTNTEWLTVNHIREMVDEYYLEYGRREDDTVRTPDH